MKNLGRTVVRAATGILVAGMVAALPTDAAAQVDPSRMFRSVFTTADADRSGVLLSVALSEGYGDPLGDIAGADAGGRPKGFYTELTPEIRLRYGRRHIFSASAQSAMRYDDGTQFTNLGHSVGAGIGTEFGRTAIMFDQTFSSHPYYAFTGIPVLPDLGLDQGLDQVPSSEFDTAALARDVFVSESTGSVSRQLGQHLWLNGRYGYRATSVASSSLLDESDERRSEHRGVIGIGRQVTQRTSMRLQYEFRTATADVLGGGNAPVTQHNITFGIDRAQAFRLTRNTTFTFGVGPALVQTQSGTAVTGAGNVSIRHQLSRTWSLNGSASRGLVYAEGFERPLMMNGLGGSVEGTITRRVIVRVIYGASQGFSDLMSLSQDGDKLSTKSLRAYTQVGLFRHLGAFVEYWHFIQSIPAGVASSLRYPINDRAGVRAGLLFRLPLLQDPQPRGAR
jgi:hypothetical protein